jgi:biopolymer transport protein ExbB
MAALAIIAQIAPTLGLLGSIIGFIHTVLAANSETIVSRADLLGGCMEALVAAAAGLAVSIIASIMYGSLRVRLDRMTVELEAAASNIVGYLSTRKDRES